MKKIILYWILGFIIGYTLIFTPIYYIFKTQDIIAELPGVITINDPNLRPLINQIENLNPGQTMHLRITSYGGEIHPTMALMNAILTTKGKVIADISGIDASAAATISIVCAEVHSKPITFVLLHLAGLNIAGTGKRLIVNGPDGSLAFNAALIHEIKKFLTPDEVKIVEDGGDLWLSGIDFAHRLNHLHGLE